MIGGIVLDASAFLRLLDSHSPSYPALARKVAEIGESRLVLPPQALYESYSILTRPLLDDAVVRYKLIPDSPLSLGSG